jgi:transcriptional regulator with XRE-family HTH domain
MSFSKSHRPSTVANAGVLLREWRAARRMSQLELALEAEVSARYLSCVETGKSQPSREMIARLAEALAMPLRERNALLMAAGYAPGYPETALRAKELGQIHRAIELILKHQEPYPAFVLNRHWDVIRANPAAVRVGEFLIGGSAHRNMVRQFFDPNDLRRVVANWEEVAGDLIRHLHDALAAIPFDTKTRALLDDVLRYPGVPSQWRGRELTAPPPPILTVEFRKDNQVLRFFSTITIFGTSRDVTIDELRIECTFPADDSTAERCRALAASA